MSKQIKKLIPYLFLLIILAGIFGPGIEVKKAQGFPITATDAMNNAGGTPESQAMIKAAADIKAANQAGDSPFKQEIDQGCSSILKWTLDGCILKFVYYTFFQIPTFILWLSALLFNVLISISLDSTMTSNSTFLVQGWGVVRDLSNIFFILILLYIAIQTILGLGHETKKMIVRVVIMALLINFSMFFTKVVIDSSNILALVFYNKLDVSTGKRDYTTSTPNKERDISGEMYKAFRATDLLDQNYLDQVRKETSGDRVLPLALKLGLMLMTGSLMLWAAYAFFVSGFAFLGRLIELWMLIVFAPFAFMSSAIPLLSKTPYIGWDEWPKRLMASSFMAPIFMFFIYLIFLLLKANPFVNFFSKEAGFVEKILSVMIPSLLIIGLLLKATKFAVKGGGQFGELVLSGAKLATGLAIGAASGGTALAGRAVVGGFMKGASTGDTAANRMVGSAARIATHRATIANPTSTMVERAQARKEIWREKKDNIKGSIQQTLGIQWAQNRVGRSLNEDQHNIEHAAHARHDLDEAANAVAPGKKWDELNGEKRFEARRKIARDRAVRDNAGDTAVLGTPPPVLGLGYRFGNRKWTDLTQAERDSVDHAIQADHGVLTPGGFAATHTGEMISSSRTKQGIISNVVQSTVTGSYDIRNLANVIAKSQSTGFAKMAMGVTGALAMGMRSGFKSAGINYGESQGKFFKDLGSTISESLKGVKINVDLSHVGEVKKEDDHGKGSGGHH